MRGQRKDGPAVRADHRAVGHPRVRVAEILRARDVADLVDLRGHDAEVHGWLRPPGWALRYRVAAPARGYACRYQWAMFQQFESQPLRSVPRSRFETALPSPRQMNGTITTFWGSSSFIRMTWAARLTGSISVSAALKSRSNSSLRQRVVLRPAHLFSF